MEQRRIQTEEEITGLVGANAVDKYPVTKGDERFLFHFDVPCIVGAVVNALEKPKFSFVVFHFITSVKAQSKLCCQIAEGGVGLRMACDHRFDGCRFRQIVTALCYKIADLLDFLHIVATGRGRLTAPKRFFV